MTVQNDNWPIEEAQAEAEYFIEYSHEKTPDENHRSLIALRTHWIAVFGMNEQGEHDMKRFSAEFNRLVQGLGHFDKAM